jgi:hypothetical protein
MRSRWEPLDHSARNGEPLDGQPESLGFEAEFDGVRRPQVAVERVPSDPHRYWDIFSGTD